MTAAVTFVLLVLSTSRLVALLQVDHITERLRETVIYNRWPYDASRGALEAGWLPDRREVQFSVRLAYGEADVPASRFGYWLHCPWCLGTWVAAAAVALTCHWASLPLPVLWWGAVAHAVGLLARFR
jgi:hypothetical protein